MPEPERRDAQRFQARDRCFGPAGTEIEQRDGPFRDRVRVGQAAHGSRSRDLGGMRTALVLAAPQRGHQCERREVRAGTVQDPGVP